MLDQVGATRLQQAVSLTNAGRRQEAAPICREVLVAYPNNISAMLWLAYTSPNQIEAEEAIAKAYELEPQNPDVLQAVNWYNVHFVDSTAPAPQAQANPTGGEPARPANTDKMRIPAGDPVPDATNFIMSQSGGMVIGSGGMLLGALATLAYYIFVRGVVFTPFGLPRVFYMILAAGTALLALGFLIFALKNLLTPPVKAYGFIKDRKEIRRQVRDRASGSQTELHYELQFMADDSHETGAMPVRLMLTKEQYEASALGNRAYVEYRKTLGSVRLYQPLRSVY
jgi:tetratricopeptide (TPR) repeat protein